MKRVAVIGCGAAGMMAACAAAAQGARVTVFERNDRPGKKVFISGKGRCNVTNDCPTPDFFAHVRRNPRFLYSAVYGFDAAAVRAFFEENGCPLKTERGGRVFPVSDHSSDIIRALTRAMERAGVTVRFRCGVRRLLFEELPVPAKAAAAVSRCVRGLVTDAGETVAADAVIVCTGGLSYPATGSTGDGYRFAHAAGHTTTQTAPSLVPFEIREAWCMALQGLSLRNAGVTMESCAGRTLYEGQGELLFTHFGISGPLILSASSFYEGERTTRLHYEGEKKARLRYEGEKEARLHIDLKPALDETQLDRRILRDFDAARNKAFKNALGGLFPSRLIPVMVELSGIDPEKRVHAITAAERRSFGALTKNLTLTILRTRGFEEAIVTSGGVCVKEVNPSTMESRRAKGMYFAGEVLDLDALTGGFNLQIAWSTGRLAGESAAVSEEGSE